MAHTHIISLNVVPRMLWRDDVKIRATSKAYGGQVCVRVSTFLNLGSSLKLNNSTITKIHELFRRAIKQPTTAAAAYNSAPTACYPEITQRSLVFLHSCYLECIHDYTSSVCTCTWHVHHKKVLAHRLDCMSSVYWACIASNRGLMAVLSMPNLHR